MDTIITKVDDSTIAVVETKPSEVLPEKTYNIDFLHSQKKAIQAQKDRDNATRDAELAEVDFLISEADKLGIKPTDPVGEATALNP